MFHTYMHIPKHVSGLLISLWEPANSLFICDKYVPPTGKWLHAGYVQKAEALKNIPFDTTALKQKDVCGLLATYYIHMITQHYLVAVQ